MFVDLYRHMLQIMAVVSGVFIVAGILSLAFILWKKRSAASVTAGVTAIAAVMNMVGALLLGLSGAQVSSPDDGAEAIKRFYTRVENKELDKAYVILSSARRNEVPIEAFKRAYADTVRYDNLEVRLDKVEGRDARHYWVNFDVYDRLPTDNLSQYQWRVLADSTKAGIVNADGLVQQLAADLRKNYEFPEARIPELKEFVLQKKFHWLFEEPTAVYEIAGYLHLQPLTNNPGEYESYWSHYAQHLGVIDEDGWKIRSGLFPSELVALYSPYSERPSGIPAHR
jgi:hypothetical protein